MTQAIDRRYRRIAPRLRKLSLHDPQIHMLVRLYMRGDIQTYEDFLEQVCFALATAKKQIMDAALRDWQEKPLVFSEVKIP